MNKQLYPTDLTDSQWNYIKDKVPSAKTGGRSRSLEMRLVINAIMYIVVGGIQWRLLPKEYPTRLYSFCKPGQKVRTGSREITYRLDTLIPVLVVDRVEGEAIYTATVEKLELR